MADLLPIIYRENNFGVKAIPEQNNQENPIVFLTWWTIGLLLKHMMNKTEMNYTLKHLKLMNLPGELYARKNSHDNITYQMLLKKTLKLEVKPDLNKICKEIGWFRLPDLIFYGRLSESFITRLICFILMPITFLQMYVSATSKGKVRPAYIEDKRFLWWHRRKKLIEIENTGNIIIKTWKFKDDAVKQTKHMQNDGKHIVLFKLLILNNKLMNKIFDKIYVKKYGQNYIYRVLYTYFGKSHPAADVYKGINNFLLLDR